MKPYIGWILLLIVFVILIIPIIQEEQISRETSEDLVQCIGGYDFKFDINNLLDDKSKGLYDITCNMSAEGE